MKFLLIKLSDLSIVQEYDADEATKYGGPWGNGALHATLEVPGALDHRTHDITEVVLGESQVEADIDFDCKHIYSDMMGPQATKYFKFVEDAGKVTSVADADTKAALKVAKDAKAAKGKAFKELCDEILHIIGGHNHDNSLDAVQINAIKTANPEAFDALSSGMPFTAKPFIDAITPDAVVTQEELDHVALAYEEFAVSHPDLVP